MEGSDQARHVVVFSGAVSSSSKSPVGARDEIGCVRRPRGEPHKQPAVKRKEGSSLFLVFLFSAKHAKMPPSGGKVSLPAFVTAKGEGGFRLPLVTAW